MRVLKIYLVMLLVAAAAAAQDPCTTAQARAVAASDTEPGERMIVSGQVFRPDGKTPAAGVIVYMYQTDARGLYSDKRGNPPRLRAWMRTDAEGRYEYESIRPGVYPSRSEPAHVHTQLWDGGAPAQWNADLYFEDDELVSERMRRESAAAGRFGFVQPARRGEDGVLRVTLNLRLKPEPTRFERSIAHGVEACGVAVPMR